MKEEITLELRDEDEIYVLIQALNYYMYNNPFVTIDKWEVANRILNRVDEEL